MMDKEFVYYWTLRIIDSIDGQLEYMRRNEHRGIQTSEYLECLFSSVQKAFMPMQEAGDNQPLTMDELREMDGEPVSLSVRGQHMEWAVVVVKEDAVYLLHQNGICSPANNAFDGGVKVCRQKPMSVPDSSINA